MSVLKKPLVSEKMELLNERPGANQYAFKAALDASKPAIKEAIEEMYDVDVMSLRTMVVRGKRRTRYTRQGFIHGKSPNFKKVVVTLGEGQEIDFYKNI
jgi:large subunit ribosomal protein L23